MIDVIRCNITGVSLHKVGNKTESDGIIFSRSLIKVGCDDMRSSLLKYFTSHFKSEEYYNLFHESDIKYNEVYGFVTAIFDDRDALYEQSVNLAKHLYEKSTHPKIKGGEFYTVYFQNFIVNGETVDAVGLFKSENKDTFLKVHADDGYFELESDQGVNVNKLDKGCLIFNMDRENGYVVAIVDNTNRGVEAQYWIDDFLHVRQRQDEYFNTQSVLSMCKNYVIKELPQQFEVSRADQVDLLNKSVKFFKENDSFDIDEFASEVIVQPEIIDSFNKYKTDFQQERDIEISDKFAISESAVKKQARALKSVIKLDKNFHIYIHGDRELIEQGEDSRGKFYKVYYNQEN